MSKEKDYSAEAFFAFMDYLKDKGLLKSATAQSRKAAGKKMLEILEPAEKQDLRQVDVEHLHDRFANKSGSGYTPDSLQVYKSRFKSARGDFINWVNSPATFKPGLAQRDSPGKGASQPRNTAPASPPPKLHVPPLGATIVFPVPLRPDLVVEIHNIPSDLTEAEAERVAAVVKALAKK